MVCYTTLWSNGCWLFESRHQKRRFSRTIANDRIRAARGKRALSMGSAINHFFISTHFLLSTYFLTVQTYKRMHLITRVYGMWPSMTKPTICHVKINHIVHKIVFELRQSLPFGLLLENLKSLARVILEIWAKNLARDYPRTEYVWIHDGARKKKGCLNNLHVDLFYT